MSASRRRPLIFALDQYRSVGAVGQPRQHRQRQGRADPPQQVRSGRHRLPPGLIVVKIVISQHEHAGGEPGDQVRGEGLLTGGDTAQFGVDDSVGAAFAQGEEADLGERAGGLVVAERPNSLSLSGVSATSSTRPSMAIRRRP